jgi:glycosyltransferase involved in cell wall biosynthesis
MRIPPALTRMVGIAHPVVQTGMGWVAGARLVSATANAGGLGILAAATMTIDELATGIAKVKSATDKPFGVNIRADAADAGDRVDLMIREGVKVASFALAPKPELIAALKEAGSLVVPSVGAAKHARKVAGWGADAVIVQNLAQQTLLRRHFQRHGVLIQNGYEEPGARPGRSDGPVLWAATVKPLKRPELFVELARRLPQRRFLMVGGPGATADGPATFDRVARLAGGLPNLRLTGHVPYAEVGTHFDGAALVLNTSDYEGLPNTFMQAWLRGIPTLSFVRPESAPGCSGTIACDGLDDMAARVEALCANPAAWTAASLACRRHFETHHTVQAAVQHYLEVFDRVLRR